MRKLSLMLETIYRKSQPVTRQGVKIDPATPSDLLHIK